MKALTQSRILLTLNIDRNKNTDNIGPSKYNLAYTNPDMYWISENVFVAPLYIRYVCMVSRILNKQNIKKYFVKLCKK